MSPIRFSLLLSTVTTCAVLNGLACRPQDSRRAEFIGEVPKHLKPLTLRRIRVLDLDRPRGVIGKIIDLDIAHNGDLFVLDQFSKRILVFDNNGKWKLEIGGSGFGPGEFISPREIALWGDFVVVADPGQGSRIPVYDRSGGFVKYVRLGSRAVMSIAANEIYMAAANPWVDFWREPNPQVVKLLGTSMASAKATCRLDPVYQESRARDGILSTYRSVSIAMSSRWLYCIQPTSSVVQVMDMDNGRSTTISIEPPFFSPIQDYPRALASGGIGERFRGQTPHVRIYGNESMFISVYGRDDLEGHREYGLLACDLGPLAVKLGNCRAGWTDLRPLGIDSFGRMFMIEEYHEQGSATVGIYAIN